jgi:hypothetical protein
VLRQTPGSPGGIGTGSQLSLQPVGPGKRTRSARNRL